MKRAREKRLPECHPASEPGFHLAPAELRAALGAGLVSQTLLTRALHHFASGCTVCLERFRDFAAQGPAPLPLDPQADNPGKLVPLALGAAVRAQRPNDHPDPLYHPALDYWLAHFAEHPLGFCRLTLETARWMTLQQPQPRALRWSEATLPLLEPRMESYDPRAYRLLRALTSAYHAEVLRRGRKWRRTQELLDQAEKALAEVDRDLERPDPIYEEIRAAVLEHRFRFEFARGAALTALPLLEEALSLLELNVHMPGRLAEAQVTMGNALLQLRQFDRARDVLRRAVDELPVDRYAPLRLMALYRLATAEFQNRSYQEAHRILGETSCLIPTAAPTLVAKVRWLEGSVLYRLGRPLDAEGPLWEAIQGFLRLAQYDLAWPALRTLVQVWLLSGRDAAALFEQYPALVDSPEAEAMSLAQGSKILELLQGPAEPARNTKEDEDVN